MMKYVCGLPTGVQFTVHDSRFTRYSTSMSDTLVVNEIYLSLQGESTFAGLPCVFIRLTACNLRCSYCDTAYAFTQGRKMSLTDVCSEVGRLARPFNRTRNAKRGTRNQNAKLP